MMSERCHRVFRDQKKKTQCKCSSDTHMYTLKHTRTQCDIMSIFLGLPDFFPSIPPHNFHKPEFPVQETGRACDSCMCVCCSSGARSCVCVCVSSQLLCCAVWTDLPLRLQEAVPSTRMRRRLAGKEGGAGAGCHTDMFHFSHGPPSARTQTNTYTRRDAHTHSVCIRRDPRLTEIPERVSSGAQEQQDAGERRRKAGVLPEQERPCRSKWSWKVCDMCGVVFQGLSLT